MQKGEHAVTKFFPFSLSLVVGPVPLPAWKADVMLEMEQPSCDREAISRTKSTLNAAEQKELSPCQHHDACVLSHFSRILFFVTLWTVALQALLSMGFSRQAYWSGLPFPPPRDLPDPRIERLMSPASAGRFFTSSTIWEALWRPQIRLWNLSALGAGQGSVTHPALQVSRPRVLSLSPGRLPPKAMEDYRGWHQESRGFTPGYSWCLPVRVRVKTTAIHSQ